MTEKKKKARAPQVVIANLENALDKIVLKRRRRCGVPIEHQEAMRLYLDTWAADPIESVLAWAKGELDADELPWPM